MSPSLRIVKTRATSPLKPKQPWSRSDKIATGAFLISILAAAIAYKADQRANQSDIRSAEAVVAAVGDKVRFLAQSAEYDGMFLGAFISHAQQYPADVNKMELLTFEFLQRLELPKLSIPTEQLALLAHSDSDAASKLAVCDSRRAEVESDIKSLAAVKQNKFMIEQANTLQVLPYRLHELSEACNQSTRSLIALVPSLPSMMGPMRGTLGEIMAAKEAEYRRRKLGLTATLTFPQIHNKKNPQTSPNAKQQKIDSALQE